MDNVPEKFPKTGYSHIFASVMTIVLQKRLLKNAETAIAETPEIQRPHSVRLDKVHRESLGFYG